MMSSYSRSRLTMPERKNENYYRKVSEQYKSCLIVFYLKSFNMKNLSMIIASVLVLVACNSYKDKEISVDFIKGKWKNCSAMNSVVEYTESGQYNVIINGEKVDAAKMKYTLYPSDKKYNIKIYESPNYDRIVNYGHIDIIDQDKIRMTIYCNDKYVTSSEFIRL